MRELASGGHSGSSSSSSSSAVAAAVARFEPKHPSTEDAKTQTGFRTERDEDLEEEDDEEDISLEEDEISTDDDEDESSTLKCPPPKKTSSGNLVNGDIAPGGANSGTGWSDEPTSSSEMSDSSGTDNRNCHKSSRKEGPTTRCDGDFRWINTSEKKPPLPTAHPHHHKHHQELKAPKYHSQHSQNPAPIVTGKPPTAPPQAGSTTSLDRASRRRKPSADFNQRRHRRRSQESPIRESPVRSQTSTPPPACVLHHHHLGCCPSTSAMSWAGSEPRVNELNGSSSIQAPPGCCFHHYMPPPRCPCHMADVMQSYSSFPRALKSPVELEERIRRLETDKESLQLQVSCLTEQIDAQAHKIRDLERTLDDRNKQLASAHDLLQREMLSRSSLETQKLELFSALSELKLQLAASERENFELRERRRSFPGKPPSTRVSQSPQASPSPVSLIENSPRRLGAHPHSLEDFKDLSQPRTPPATYRRTVDHYGSLPRTTSRSSSTAQHPPSTPQHNHLQQGPPSGSPPRKGVVFAETEPVVIEDTNGFEETDIPSDSSGYGRIKRSGSGSLDELASPEGPGEFRRGGVRSTAGPRLGWTAPGPPALPFTDWDSAAVCLWLQHLGLDCYVHDASKWVKSGAQLLSASPGDVDKELGIKNPLHRKKLQLALLAQQPSIVALDPLLEPASLLDTAWVLRWLDDQGLPQHKEAFLAARADGRTLHRLTTDDLYHLHVTNSLHVASLRRGIQVLRENGFNPNCLERRSQPIVVNEESSPPPPTPSEISRWSNHRVMEWLRVVDLAEYAPNLRGSGVHGGLLVYEPRFTAELLACLLSIPAGKTLLRRHLNTHFNQLLGKDCIQEKRDAETTLGYIPLTPTTKLKVAKKSQFTLKRKKSKSELDFGDLVCPLDPKSDDSEHNVSKNRGCLSGH